jgi:hypothetical protein
LADRFPTGLSPHAELVLAVIEKELHGRTPTPELLTELTPHYRDLVPGHIVTMNALPKLPGGRRRRKVRWELAITGPGIDGKWRFSNGWLIRRFQKWRMRPNGLD